MFPLAKMNKTIPLILVDLHWIHLSIYIRTCQVEQIMIVEIVITEEVELVMLRSIDKFWLENIKLIL